MHLVDDVDFVLAGLGGVAHLLHQRADILHRVVGRRVQLMHVERSVFLEGHAGRAGATSLGVRTQVGAVYRLGQDAGTSGFTHPARATKQERLGQVLALNGILQRGSDVLLPHHTTKRGRTVLAGRNDEIIHKFYLQSYLEKGGFGSGVWDGLRGGADNQNVMSSVAETSRRVIPTISLLPQARCFGHAQHDVLICCSRLVLSTSQTPNPPETFPPPLSFPVLPRTFAARLAFRGDHGTRSLPFGDDRN